MEAGFLLFVALLVDTLQLVSAPTLDSEGLRSKYS